MPDPKTTQEKPSVRTRIRQLISVNLEIDADEVIATLKREKYKEEPNWRPYVHTVRYEEKQRLKKKSPQGGKAGATPVKPAGVSLPPLADIAKAPDAPLKPTDPGHKGLAQVAFEGATAGKADNTPPPTPLEVVVAAHKLAMKAGGIDVLASVAGLCKTAGTGAVHDIVDLCIRGGVDRVTEAADALKQIEAASKPA